MGTMGAPSSGSINEDRVLNDCMSCLEYLYKDELKDNSAMHRDVVKTLMLVISNLVNKPLDVNIR